MTDDQWKIATRAIDKLVEPKLRKIIEGVNSELKKNGIVVGVELKWVIQEISENEKSN